MGVSSHPEAEREQMGSRWWNSGRELGRGLVRAGVRGGCREEGAVCGEHPGSYGFLRSSVASRAEMVAGDRDGGCNEQLWPPPGKGFSRGDHPAGRLCLPSPQCPLWRAPGLGSKQRVGSLSPWTALLPQVLEGRLGLTCSVPAGILPGSCRRGLLWGQLLWDT